MFPASQTQAHCQRLPPNLVKSLRRTHRSKRVAFEAMELYTFFDNKTGTLPVAERPKCYKDEEISRHGGHTKFHSRSSAIYHSSRILHHCHGCQVICPRYVTPVATEVPHSLFILKFLALFPEMHLHYNLMDPPSTDCQSRFLFLARSLSLLVSGGNRMPGSKISLIFPRTAIHSYSFGPTF
jgi:hypothetical protein